MLNVVAFEQSQLNSATNAIVGAQCGAFCFQPFAVNIGLNGVVEEVDVNVYQIVAYHVHVALKDNDGLVFITWCGGFANNNVACFVNLSFQVVALAKLFQVFNHFLLML